MMDDAKLKLRFHRQELDIDSQEHLILLNNLGWTLDDYEVSTYYVYVCVCVSAVCLLCISILHLIRLFYLYCDHMMRSPSRMRD